MDYYKKLRELIKECNRIQLEQKLRFEKLPIKTQRNKNKAVS